MASTELLASKIVILEEEPQIPSIAALPSAVVLALGLTERGPIADRTLLTSFEEYTKTFGGFTTYSEVALAMHGYFYNGGSFAWVSRTCHFTDLTDPASYIAVKGTVMLQNSGTLDTPASVGPGSDAAPFVLDPGQHIDIDIGSGPVVCTFDAAAGYTEDTTTTYPCADQDGLTVILLVDGEPAQTATFSGATTTLASIMAQLNAQLSGCKVADNGSGQPKIISDKQGTGSSISAPSGTSIFTWETPTAGTGDVADIKAVTKGEAEALIESDMTSLVAVTFNGSDQMSIATVAVGSGEEIQVEVTSTVDFGLDNTKHLGADATPENTLKVDGKTPGAYTAGITTTVEAATSGDAEFFNFKVLKGGLVKEVFPNVTMDDVSVDFVETRVNHVNLGSNLVAVTDQDVVGTPTEQRPANGTSSALTGGDDGQAGLVDADYVGNEAGPTGLFCFDNVETGRILIVPGVYTPAVHLAMIDYAEAHRNGTMFCVLDPPPQQTAAQMVTYVDTNGLLELSEFAAIYWPWVKIVNPSTTVFGNDESLAVAPSGWIAGKYASNDQKLGGIYESPAGIGQSFGIIRGVIGVEDDPGGSERHEVLDERKRDLVYPKRINPITQQTGTPWHIDGGRTLKSTGNFPNIGERRGVIFIETSLKAGLLVMKHRFNNKQNRQQVRRIVTTFLNREMNKDAFRSKDSNTAYFVDVSDALNPLANEFAGIMTLRVGLATNKPGEFIVVLVTQDTRALNEQLAA